MKIEDIFDSNKPIIIYHTSRIVYHTTNEKAALGIYKDGFKSGKELNINEKRNAVYFSDIEVNPGLYARNDREGEPNYGQKTSVIPLDLQGLRLMNMGYEQNGEWVFHNKYKAFVVRGELNKIPEFAAGKIDGTISYLENGDIYEVCLPTITANNRLAKQNPSR
jgi:hypothetical protein